jgi:hypothetical protein
MRCSLQFLSLPSILNNGSSLQTIGIRHNTWYHEFQENHIICPSLSLTNLMDFRVSCPLLREVTLHLDWKLCNVGTAYFIYDFHCLTKVR